MSENSLRKKTIKGVGWSAADAIFGQGVTFVVGIILARVLSPEEYGLIGICLIFNSILSGIVDSGFSNALIRKNEISNNDYNTMFITNMVISIGLYTILFACAENISFFFNNEELIYLIRVVGLILILNALSITQVTRLTKKLDFKTKTKASLISGIISGILGITSAFANLGVWALVIQLISKQLFYTIFLWYFSKWIPTLIFDYSCFKYMWGFGSKLMISGLLNNVWNQLYQVVIGKFYAPASLGQYTRANEYANIFSSNLTVIVQRVSYPVLSEIQDNHERMLTIYRKIIKVTMFITTICLIPLGAVAEPLIYTLIGPQWGEAASYLPLICVSMSMYPLHAINLNMLQIQGRSDIFLYLEIIKKVIGTIPLCIGIFINVYWMLFASIITGFIAFFLNSYYTGKKMSYGAISQLRDVIPNYIIACLVSFVIYSFKYLPYSNLSILIIQFIVASFLIIAICEYIKLSQYLEVKNIIYSLLKK